jgi:hypothetical protein
MVDEEEEEQWFARLSLSIGLGNPHGASPKEGQRKHRPKHRSLTPNSLHAPSINQLVKLQYYCIIPTR